jgi:CheY-like chemotaxis protein
VVKVARGASIIILNRPMGPGNVIILIEENEADARALQASLVSQGIDHPICRMACPSEAKTYLEAATDGGGKNQLPAAVILSLGLEARVGFDFVRWVRRQSALNGLIIITLGDLRRLRDVQDAYASGANAFFVKSPDAGALIRTLQSAFGPSPAPQPAASLTHPAFRDSTDLYGSRRSLENTRMGDRSPVLLVDDSEAHTKQFAQSLDVLRIRNGFQRVSSADEAIAYLAGSGIFADRATYGFPIVLFLDIRMADSHKLLAWLEGHPEARPSGIIALTTSHDMRPVIQAYHLGVHSFLKEPIKLEEMRNALQAIPKAELRAEADGNWIRARP